jgi:hypothetical protein
MGFKVKRIPFLPEGGKAINDGINQFIDTFIDPLFKSRQKEDLGITSSGKENPPFKGEGSLSKVEENALDRRILEEIKIDDFLRGTDLEGKVLTEVERNKLIKERAKTVGLGTNILQFYDPVVSSLEAMNISKTGTKGKNILANLYKRSPEIKTASLQFRDLERLIDPEKLYTKKEIVDIAKEEGLDVTAEVYEGQNVKYGFDQRQNLDLLSNLTEEERKDLIKNIRETHNISNKISDETIEQNIFQYTLGNDLYRNVTPLDTETTNKYFEINLRAKRIKNIEISERENRSKMLRFPSTHFPDSFGHARGTIMDVLKPDNTKERVIIMDEFQTDLFKADQQMQITRFGEFPNATGYTVGNVDFPLANPIKIHADYIEKLMYSLMIYGKENNVSKIIIPQMDRIAEPRDKFGYTLNKKIYKSAVNTVLKKIKAEFGDTVEIGRHKIPYANSPVLLKKQMTDIARKYGLSGTTIKKDIFNLNKEKSEKLLNDFLIPTYNEIKGKIGNENFISIDKLESIDDRIINIVSNGKVVDGDIGKLSGKERLRMLRYQNMTLEDVDILFMKVHKARENREQGVKAGILPAIDDVLDAQDVAADINRSYNEAHGYIDKVSMQGTNAGPEDVNINLDHVLLLLETEPSFINYLVLNQTKELTTMKLDHIDKLRTFWGKDWESLGVEKDVNNPFYGGRIGDEHHITSPYYQFDRGFGSQNQPLQAANDSLNQSAYLIKRFFNVNTYLKRMADPYRPLYSTYDGFYNTNITKLGEQLKKVVSDEGGLVSIERLESNKIVQKTELPDLMAPIPKRDTDFYKEIILAAERVTKLQKQLDKQKTMTQEGNFLDISKLDFDLDTERYLQARGFAEGGLVSKGLMSKPDYKRKSGTVV